MDEHTHETAHQADDQADGYAADPATEDRDGPRAEEEAGEGEREGADERPWSGWGSFSEIQDAVSGLVDSALKTVAPATGRFPRYDLVDLEDEGYLILFDLPGLAKSDVDVKARAGEVSVEGTRTRPTFPDGARVERTERTYGRFRRAVAVPADIDMDRVSAKMENGVLEIRLPRRSIDGAQHIRVD